MSFLRKVQKIMFLDITQWRSRRRLKQEKEERGKTVIEINNSMQGRLVFEKPVLLRISDKFEGNLYTDEDLIIEEGAVVDADIEAGEIIASGKVSGKLVARQGVTIVPPASVSSEIQASCLGVVKGADFHGNFKSRLDGFKEHFHVKQKDSLAVQPISLRATTKIKGTNIIAIANQKGGCGKTTTAINLSACLVLENRKVLVIDMDPQNHASAGLGVNTNGLQASMYDVLVKYRPPADSETDSKEVSLDDIIVPILPNLDLAPANIVLCTIEQVLGKTEQGIYRLQAAISRMKKRYDYILIDCPPSMGFLTFNALKACHEVIMPIEIGFFSLRGVSIMLEAIKLLVEKLDKELNINILVTLYEDISFTTEILKDVYLHFKNELLETKIHNSLELREATSLGMPVTEYSQSSTGFKDYKRLAKEIIQKIEKDRRPLNGEMAGAYFKDN